MLNDKEIKARLNPLLKEITQLQTEFKNLCFEYKHVKNEEKVPYTEIFELFKNKKKILTFLQDYHGTGVMSEAWASCPTVKLVDMHLDLSYQRITDLLKCFENVIKVEGFDGTLAEPLMTFRSYGQYNWRVADGGHRIIMLFLVGETEYSVLPIEHGEGLTSNEEREIEAQRFVVKNSISNEVQFISIYKAWLCFPKNTSEYEDAQSVLTTLGKANIDVKHGYFYPDAPRIDKLQDIFKALLVTPKKGDKFYKYYSADSFITASKIMQTAYIKPEEIIIEDLLCLARLIEKSEDGVFDNFDVKDVPFLNTEAISMAYINYAKKHSMGYLTKDTLQKNKLATLDYNVMNTLFKLKKKDRNYLETLWSPTIEE
jgi:hypothetical protein